MPGPVQLALSIKPLLHWEKMYWKQVMFFDRIRNISRLCPGFCPTGGGHFNFICTGVCGHRIGKLTHPQTKAGPKADPFSDYLQ